MKKMRRINRSKIQFLKWLAEEPRPWLSRYISDWETRWSRWEQIRVRRSVMLWGALADTAVSDDGHRHAPEKAFYYWKRMHYIEVCEDNGRFLIALTGKGRCYLNRSVLRDAPPLPEGMVMTVFFDMPIGAVDARNTFRYLLKQNGFWQLQQSVWCIDRDVRMPLRELLRGLELDCWVVFGVMDFRESYQTIKRSELKRRNQKAIFVREIESDRLLSRSKR